jgi:glycerol kinase
MRERYVAAIDQGTASSRCLVFDRSGRIVSVAQKEHHHVYPRPGWVEHDPEEIWRNVEEVIARALSDARLEPTDLVALGIANQRETTIVWDRQTGQAVHPAINWQDMRTDQIVRALAAGVLLLGTQAALAARRGSGAQRPRAGRRGAVRDDGLMADLASDRAASDRRDQRQPHAVDEPAHARLR